MITAAQMRGERGRPVYDWAEIVAEGGGRAGRHWAVLTGCRKGAVRAALAGNGPRGAERELRRLVDAFGRSNMFVELVDHRMPLDDETNDALAALATRVQVGIVASTNTHYAGPRRAQVAAVLAATRAQGSLDELVGWLPATRTAHLRSGAEMARRLHRSPAFVSHRRAGPRAGVRLHRDPAEPAAEAGRRGSSR